MLLLLIWDLSHSPGLWLRWYLAALLEVPLTLSPLWLGLPLLRHVSFGSVWMTRTRAHFLLPLLMLHIITSSSQLFLPTLVHWFCPLGCLILETGWKGPFLLLQPSSPRLGVSLLSVVLARGPTSQAPVYPPRMWWFRWCLWRSSGWLWWQWWPYFPTQCHLGCDFQCSSVCSLSSIIGDAKSRSQLTCHASWQFSLYTIGAVVALLLLMCTSFTSKPLKRLPPNQAMPYRWVSSRSYLPTFQLVALRELILFPFVAETLGGLADDIYNHSVGQAVGQRAASSIPSNCTRHLFLHVTISLWHGNASLWLHRYPTVCLIKMNDSHIYMFWQNSLVCEVTMASLLFWGLINFSYSVQGRGTGVFLNGTFTVGKCMDLVPILTQA